MRKVFLLLTITILVFTFAGCDTEKPKVSGVEKTVEVQCGTKLNLKDYLKEKIKISDRTDKGVKNYKLDQLEYSIDCDKTIYNSKTGDVNTDQFGKFRVSLTVSDKAGNDTTVSFKLILNPIKVEKDFYIYEDSPSDDYELMGYCSFENTSKQPVAIEGIKFDYTDKDGVSVCGSDMVEYSPKYLAGGEIGFAKDTYSGSEAKLETEEDISSVSVKVDYKATKKKDKTTLKVGPFKMIYDYDYDQSHFAAETILTNPFEEEAEDYSLIAGMYDKNNKLIGVLENILSNGSIKANGKRKAIVSYLPPSKERPKKTKSVKGSAYVSSFKDEY